MGLPGVRRIFDEWRNSPQAVIGLFPDWFAQPAPDCPAALRLTGFLFNDCGNMADLSPEVDAFLSAGPPPIVCTPGSATRSAHSFFEESIRACVQLKRRGLLFTPHAEQIPACLPPGIRHFQYAPFGRVLKRACALIHTGGIGTAAQALAAAIPQIVMPLKNDQPDNARRLQRLGVSRTISRSTFRASLVHDALWELLACPEVAKRCRLFAARIAAADPLAETCRLIEQHIERHCRRTHRTAVNLEQPEKCGASC
jgi:UDP:flavonoid glycosyltransferase YjiC (YdhE family)